MSVEIKLPRAFFKWITSAAVRRRSKILYNWLLRTTYVPDDVT